MRAEDVVSGHNDLMTGTLTQQFGVIEEVNMLQVIQILKGI